MEKRYFLIKNLILIFILFFNISVFAQVQNGDITLDISPLYPNANEEVNARLSSYVIDLNKANISWSVNNQEIQRGIGKKIISFSMDDLGIETIITADIQTINGENIRKNLIIPSANVDMLWEAVDSYAPPFYKGKTLVAKEGSFKVVALPSIILSNKQINPNNLSYAWKKDNNGQTNASGWGKSSFIFKNSYLDVLNKIEVKVSDISGKTNIAGKLNLQTIQPQILFYEKESGVGIKLEKSLDMGYEINKNGATLVAIPYFFSPKDLNSSNLKWEWFVNKEKIETPILKNELSVKGEEGSGGTAKIKIIISNTKTLFQEAEKEISVSF